MSTPSLSAFAGTLCLCAAISAAGAAMAQNPLDSYSQIGTPKKSGKITSFNPLVTGEVQPKNLREVICEALLTKDDKPMQHGLSWRVFSPIPGADGKLPLLATSEGGSAAFRLEPGEYFINVAFGRAAATKKLVVPENAPVEKQTMVLDAGGIMLNAVSGSDVRIPPNELTFSVYSSEVGEDGERSLVVPNVKANTVVRLNAGTYHVVSDYGTVNAVIRADIQVEAGKLIQATIQHRAAKLTLKLVSEEGGEAIADTAWSILTSSGDVVSESVGAFPTLVLAEGQYTAIARNKNKIYQRDFTVTAGQNTDVEVLLAEAPEQQAQVATETD
ncbi:hypothetical protein [Mycoplana dimorpha]|uniref:Carboxypeptidase family protein n=1 Tax=Mycoplana dimorpha TaxID=28320 RepID=A0A2T5B7R8_MYCDI|nr:hypothetical protein [Mycoplana dimorpha]PTM94973.1 hypothetical protein C7449_10436 [Mycoplana dimorpha]